MTIYLEKVDIQHERFPVKDCYPFSLPVFNNTNSVIFKTPVTIFVGENGAGKSTLLESAARACGIHIWSMAEGARYRENYYEKLLYQYITPDWTNGSVPGAYFGSDIFRDFTHILDEWAALDPGQLNYFGGESLVTKSHGQSMMSFFRARYKIKGIYFLDEPETALSPKSQLELLDIICESSKSGNGQFIIATHSPILSACSGATIYSFDQNILSEIEYEETEHYKVYKDFLENRDKYL